MNAMDSRGIWRRASPSSRGALLCKRRCTISVALSPIAAIFSRTCITAVVRCENRGKRARPRPWLAEHLGGSLSATVAFGDSHNDLEMLRDAGFGVVMANGVGPCKQVAAKTSVWTNEQAAVGRELELLEADDLFCRSSGPPG